jgi:predicted transcriptional regulator
MWNGVPVIRKEIAESMINDFGLNQKETAQKLGLTPAAVCQYRAKKRGKIKIVDQTILTEIRVSAQRIIEKDEAVIMETCRICKIMRTNNIFPVACQSCPTDEE